MKQCPEIRDFIKSEHIDKKINLRRRDAFHGGRTEVFRSFYECEDGEKCLYYDITSLYSWVMSRQPLPLRHPKIHKGKEVDFNQIHGLALCKILPPKNLHIPVLGNTANKRLMFGLFRTCVNEQNVGACAHTENERALTDNYCTAEIRKALECGYTMQEVYEVWEFETQQGLFESYVNSFLQLKQENSGYPVHCTTEAEKQEYINYYEKHENVKLD